jgi:hypothetical protein
MATQANAATHASESTESSKPQKAQSLEEGLAAAEKYQGDPLDCPCIQHMKEGFDLD